MSPHARWQAMAQAMLLALSCCTWSGQVQAQTGTATAPAALPIQAFAHVPRLTGVSLSPDGQSVAALINIDDHTLLFTRKLMGADAKPVPVIKTDNQTFQFAVLLIHGTMDRTVPIDQSEAMDKALRRAGKPHQFIELEGGDHQLSRNSHRLTVFKALEDFLGEQLAAPKVLPQQP